MKTYQTMIIEATKCSVDEVSEVEDIMRNDVLHSTLDWLTLKQFNKAAKEAYEVYLYMKSPEGIEYIKQLTMQMQEC